MSGAVEIPDFLGGIPGNFRYRRPRAFCRARDKRSAGRHSYKISVTHHLSGAVLDTSSSSRVRWDRQVPDTWTSGISGDPRGRTTYPGQVPETWFSGGSPPETEVPATDCVTDPVRAPDGPGDANPRQAGFIFGVAWPRHRFVTAQDAASVDAT